MMQSKEGNVDSSKALDAGLVVIESNFQQGLVRARVLNDLSAEEKERYKADISATNILLQGIPKDIYSLINHYTDANVGRLSSAVSNYSSKPKDISVETSTGSEVLQTENLIDSLGQNRGSSINPGQRKPSVYNYNRLGHIVRECPRPKRLQDSDYFKDKMLLMQDSAVLDEEQSCSCGERCQVDDDGMKSP
ncbi:hypothetical protein Tco_0813114 [Tanacetum coccineum]